MQFYIPPTLQNDFQDAINSGLGTTFTVNFDSTNTLKALVPEIDHRDKSGSTSKGTKWTYADINNNLKLGDYLQDVNGCYIISQLKVEKFPSCYKLLTEVCNTKFTITRYQDQVLDGDGNVVTAKGDNPVVSDIYCSTVVNGNQFNANIGGVGIIPIDQAVVATQFNNNTKVIAIGDNFFWYKYKYQITNIDYSQVNIDGTAGLMVLYGKRLDNNASTV